jgi:uncharacterized protein
MKNILIEGSAGKPIVLDVFLADNPQAPLVIFSHGFKGFKDWGAFNIVAQSFAQEGISFLKFNFSYNGTTPSDLLNFLDLEAFGNNNFSIEMDDLGLVIDWAEQNLLDKVDTKQIALLGHSRGGGISILKAREDDRVKKVVSWASVSNFENRLPKEKDHIWKERGVAYVYNGRTNQQMPMYYQFREDFYQSQDRLDIPAAASSLSTPLLIVHGTADPTVALSEAHQLKNYVLNSELYLVEGADHVFNVKHPLEEIVLSKELQLVVDKTISFLKG